MDKSMGFIGVFSVILVIVAGINASIGLYGMYGFFVAIFGLAGAPLHMFLPWYAIVEWHHSRALSTNGLISIWIWAFYVTVAAVALIASFLVKYRG